MRDHAAWTAFLEAHHATPFGWTRVGIDCARFSFGAIKALTRTDHLRKRGWTWRNRKQAEALMQANGGLAAMVDMLLTEVPPALAQRGDLALLDDGQGRTLGVIEGETVCGPGERGLERLPRGLILKAWAAE